MPIVTLPAFVTTLLMAYFTPVLDWFSDHVYANLIRRDPQHLLVRLFQQLDTARLEAVGAAFYHAQGPGAPPTHTASQLMRALLVKYLYDWSLRQLEWQIRYHLIVKWFVGYAVYADGPDHTTLERFEQWLDQYQHRAIFDEVVRQIDAALPEERAAAQHRQVGDTYALQANAAKEGLVRLIRHACQRLLATLAAADPAREAQVRAQLEATALFGPADERREYYLSDAQRAARVQTTVLAALTCADLAQSQRDAAPALPPLACQTVTNWIDIVRKIIADEVEIKPLAPHTSVPVQASTGQPAPVAVTPPVAESSRGAGQTPFEVTPSVDDAPSEVTPHTDPAPPVERQTVAQRSQPAKGAYRIGSATDPDATYRLHGERGAGKSDLGYNVNVLVSQHFVREIEVATGAQPDATLLPAMLITQQQQHDLIPDQVVYDAAAGNGKMRRQVADATRQRTQLIAPLPPAGRRNSLFGPEHFASSDNGTALTCPNGLTTSIAYRSGSGDGRDFRFLGEQCQGCPLWSQCRSPKLSPDSRAMRQVFISDYRLEVQAARAFNQTAGYKATMKRRFVAEQIIAGLVRYNGGRRARRHGLRAADFQAKMDATAFNLKRWVRLTTLRQRTAQKPAVA